MASQEDLEGKVDLAIIESIDVDSLRGVVSLMSTGAKQNCIFGSSPMGGSTPKVGSMCLIFKQKGSHGEDLHLRYLMSLSDMTDNKRTLQERAESGRDEPPGTVPRVEEGDSYVGGNARLIFDKSGNANLKNKLGNLSLELNNTVSKMYGRANNFSFETHGSLARIGTSSSVPSTFGDTICMEKNVFVPTTPPELEAITGAVSVLTNLARIEIDSIGGITLDAVKTTPLTPTASLKLSPLLWPGWAILQNTLSSISLTPDGTIGLAAGPGPAAALSLLSGGTILASTGSSYMAMWSFGLTEFSSTGDLSLDSDTNILNTAKVSISLTAPSVTVTGSTSVVGTLSVSGIPTLLGTASVPPVPLAGAFASAWVTVIVNTPTGPVPGLIPVVI